MHIDTVVERLLREGTVARVSRGYYTLLSSQRATAFRRTIPSSVDLTRMPTRQMVSIFAEIVDYPNCEWRPIPTERMRLERHSYHSSYRLDMEQFLREIPADEDGFVRSYGLEWEIYSLDADQEDALARLLSTLPPHITESDGSLGSSGIEIVFYPMSRQRYVDTFTKLQAFCREHTVWMRNTGAHTTYGFSGHTATRRDLQIRLNRVALAIKALGTQQAIRQVFGRDFCDYARLPSSTTTQDRYTAFSTQNRSESCFEMRLINWQADIEKVLQVFDMAEFAFTRPFAAQDFAAIYSILGCDTEGV